MKRFVRIVCATVAAALTLSIITGCAGRFAAQSGIQFENLTYQDIPGVTDAEKAEIDALRDSGRSFVYGAMVSTEAFVGADGGVSGFTELFCLWLSDFFQMPFIPEHFSGQEVIDGLRDGSIDFTGDLTASASNRQTYMMTDTIAQRSLNIFQPEGSESFFSSVSLSAQKQELAPIIEVMQKALNEGGNRHIAKLYDQGYQEYKRSMFVTNLTSEELGFIIDNPVIPFAAEYNSYPLSFYNTHEGQWQGISHDVLREAGALTGLEFKVINEPETSWSDLLAMLESGEALIISELVRSADREGRFIWPETIFLTDQAALISRTEFPDISVNEVYFAKIGLGTGNAYTELFHRWFPDHRNAVEYSSMTNAFNALEAGEVDMIMNTYNMLLQLTNYQELSGYKANIVFDNRIESTFGLNKDAVILRGIIDKTLELIDTESISQQWLRRTFDYRLKLAQAQTQTAWTFGTALVLGLALAFLIFVYFNERKKRRIIAEQSAAQLANRAKSEFLAVMSHEIRTPMNSIMGFAELARDIAEEPQIGDYLGKIMDSTEWLLRIINDILDLSKIESGKMELENVPFSLQDIFSRCQSVIMPAVREKGLDFSVCAQPMTGMKPKGDPIRLYQALINLLSNAVKFTDEGSVTLTSSLISTADSATPNALQRRLRDEAGSATVYFEVKDTGIGMSREQIGRVFEPFTQADTSTTRNYGGTGLGLTIVKSIVELMGGELRLESTPGKGSVFSFELTFETTDAAEDTIDSADLDGMEKPRFDGLILICDDNPMNREVICEHLANVGLRTVMAENGEIGVAIVKERMQKGEGPFDLIFMDVFMPVMDGMEAASMIMEMDTGSPIVAMTANMMASEMEKYRNHGMPDCLGKPFTSRELWRILLKHIALSEVKPYDGSAEDGAERRKRDRRQSDRRTGGNREEAAGAHEAEGEDGQPDGERNNSGAWDLHELFDYDLEKEVFNSFVRNNRMIYAEISEAIESGDVPGAHRLVHSLKGNAGMIGKTVMQNAAAEIEAELLKAMNDESEALNIPEPLMNVLKSELDQIFNNVDAEL